MSSRSKTVKERDSLEDLRVDVTLLKKNDGPEWTRFSVAQNGAPAVGLCG